jgi:hypothetical protein
MTDMEKEFFAKAKEFEAASKAISKRSPDPNTAPVTQSAPAPAAPVGIPCKTCDAGYLQRKSVHRMSSIVVLIGYIMVIPSVLGMAFGLFCLIVSLSATSDTTSGIRDKAKGEMTKAGVPSNIIQMVMDGKIVQDADKRGLTQGQLVAIESARIDLSAGMAGAGIGGAMASGFSIFIIISSLIGGLLGYLLIMKKEILKCTNCGVVMAAS